MRLPSRLFFLALLLAAPFALGGCDSTEEDTIIISYDLFEVNRSLVLAHSFTAADLEAGGSDVAVFPLDLNLDTFLRDFAARESDVTAIRVQEVSFRVTRPIAADADIMDQFILFAASTEPVRDGFEIGRQESFSAGSDVFTLNTSSTNIASRATTPGFELRAEYSPSSEIEQDVSYTFELESLVLEIEAR
jgi:hypothetical protein